MIYLVTRNSELFDNEDYKIIGVDESLSLLSPLRIVGFDTETEGFSPFLKKLLLTQLGCYDFQVVIDNRTVPIELYRDFLQSDRLFLGWNLKFDLRFMYYHNIIPKNIYDGYLMEKAIWQGYPSGMHSLSLKAAGETYCGVELDKSIRGKIIWSKSLTPDIIKYAAEDVKYLEKIREKQVDILVNRGQKRLIDIDIENKAVFPTAYFEFCGTKLDVDGWKLKMQKDKKRLIEAEDKLNKFVVDFYKSHKANLEQYSIVDWFDFSKGLPQYKWKPYKGDTSKLPPIPESQDQAWNSDYHPIIKVFPFVKVDLQGNLFTGYDTEPKCIVNWNSARQVIPLLEYFGFNLMTVDKDTGKPKKSVDATIIEGQRNVHKIADVYLEYKAAQKVVSTYGQNVLDLINPATGRIHTNFNQIGTDTFRLSSGGGDDHEVIPGRKIPLVNLQNLPADAETRACFIAEKGNKWISMDYSGEESVILANISKDKAMIELFTTGCKDLHSLVAKMVFKEELKDIPVEEIKAKRPDLRKNAKSPEFTISYGGDENTLAAKDHIPIEEARVIKKNYMEGFKGVAAYQTACRKEIMKLGYIDECPEVGYRTYIYDFKELKEIEKKFKEPGFWDYYREMKKTSPDCDTVKMVKKYFKRKSASERQSINYRIQSRGSAIFKIAAINFFNWIVQNNLFNKVKMCIPVHDEFNIEAPEDIAEEVAAKLHECMINAGKYICRIVPLEADTSRLKDGSLPTYWIH